MPSETSTSDRVTHTLDRMKAGDDAFDRRDRAGMDAVHHPGMVTCVTRTAEPVPGRDAHAAAMETVARVVPDVRIDNGPCPIQFGDGDLMTVAPAVGTLTGLMTSTDGSVVSPTGTSLDVEIATTARWEGDVLVEEQVLLDSAPMVEQIGLRS